ncbi:hypothetical protein C8Q73DRAFT_743560 [Cubamyces lactineus]|nr:hypothetical protein C8Q73DRAFT_743560 [Cubamyces lactineus]
MSHILARDSVLVRESWPRRLTVRLPKTESVEKLAPWQVMPIDYDDVCAWATVERQDNAYSAQHPYVLLYSPEVAPQHHERLRVSLRFQGVVEALNISPLGNYDGRIESASRAVQFLSLGPGTNPDVFQHQLRAFETLRVFLGSVMNCSVQTNIRKKDTLYFQRLVFTKVRRNSVTPVRSVLVFGDDPNGWAVKLQRDWVVTHKILTGIYDESCTAVKKPHTVIRLGDFVEVVASVEIVKYRKYQRWITEVRLILQEVLRICDKNTVMQMPENESTSNTSALQKDIHMTTILGSPQPVDVEMEDASNSA